MKVTDLIYGGNEYLDDIKKLFPDAKIEDALDQIHEDRISIEVEMEEEEYFRKIILNGFGKMSLSSLLLDRVKVSNWLEEWKKEYPECFKESV